MPAILSDCSAYDICPRVRRDADKRQETSKNERDERCSSGVLHSRASNARTRRVRSFELALRERRLGHAAVCRMLVVAVTTCVKGKALINIEKRWEGIRFARDSLEALFHNYALRAQAHGENHPSLVVEVAEDHRHALALLTERV